MFSSPFIIPIIALCIPIVAIIANAFVKTRGSNTPQLEQKINDLEAKVTKLELNNTKMITQISEMEENQSFLGRLIEDKNK